MSWAHYLLQVNIYLIVFYCFYKLLLDRETYFVLNRIYLIAAGGLSLAIPFLRFEWFSKQEVTQQIYVGVDQLNNLVAQVSIVDDSTEQFNWGNLIVFVYLTGILFCIGRLVFQLIAVKKLFSKIGNGVAFSFFRKKVISNNVPELATVNLHEDIHIKQLHTADVLFFELIGILAWFNPIIYAYKKTVKNIHEFLADEAAAKFQGDKEAYAMLLLSQAFGVTPNALTNRFFTKSLIKKRIFMLHKQRSKKTAVLKYGLFVPLFALTLVLSSATIRKNDQILAIAEQIPLNDAQAVVGQAIAAPLSVVNLSPPPPAVTKIFAEPTTVETKTNTPITTGEDNANSWDAFYNYLGNHIKYPSAAVNKRLQGNTVINFTVSRGKVSNVNIKEELGEGCDEEVIDQILTYDDYFQKDGNYSLKVLFKLEGAQTSLKNEHVNMDGDRFLQSLVVQAYAPKEEIDQRVYSFVSMESPPTYQGGINKFYEFLSKNIKYPVPAADNEIQGNVFVSFTVEKDGSLSDIKVDRSLGYGTDEEAIRVLKLSKRWIPGIQNGRAVRVKYNIPIRFALSSGPQPNKTKALASIRLKNYESSENAPLLVVDGEIIDHSLMSTIDPNNIEQISILKDANAISLYGNGAKNGAIVITSKKQKQKEITLTVTNRN